MASELYKARDKNGNWIYGELVFIGADAYITIVTPSSRSMTKVDPESITRIQ